MSRIARVLVPVLVGSVFSSVLVGAPVAMAVEPPQVSAATVDPVTDASVERPDAVSAMVSAQAQGVPVEDVSQRTEDTRVFANPDGTWSSEVASGPVRMRQEDGSWVDLDTTLEQNASGEWVPQAATVDLTFSDGGSEPFVTMDPTVTTSMSLSWPEPLPAPVVEEATLTYRNVVPNGDLVVQALPEGFSHDIVLRQAPAEPVEYPIPVDLDGLQLVDRADGWLSLRTDAGKEVAAAPEPLMWDAGSTPAGEPEPDTVAPVDTTVEGTGANTQLVLAPDMAVLTDPATQYPVTIDPTFNKQAFRDTWVQNADYTTSQVGSTELRAGTYDGGGHKARSFVDFDTDTLNGKHILNATLRLRNYYSGSCANGAIRVNAINESWNKDTLTWANQPAVYSGFYDEYANAYGYTGCLEAGFATWNITGMTRNWTDGTWVNRGLRVKATDETSNSTWRKYRSANWSDSNMRPRLIVDYNSYPNKPGVPSVSPVAGSTTSGLVTKDATPTLSAKVSDPDGGKLRGYFEVRDGGGALAWSGQSTLVASGSTASVTVPSGSALNHGTTYTVKAWGDDDTNRSKSASSTTFKVDTQAPATPAVTATALTDGAWTDPAPTSNTFTFSSTAGDVTTFSYTKDDGAWASKTADSAGEATLDWNPANGAHTLKVKATDNSGNTSAIKSFSFGVGGAELSLPVEEERSTSTFDIDATAPGGATGVSLQWRLAGDTTVSWNPASEVSHADTGDPWTGSVTTVDGVSYAQNLVWDASAETGVPSPALLELLVCFTYTGGLEKCSPAREVHTVPHAFGSSFPTAPLGPGQVGLFTGELEVSTTDVEVPAYTGTLSLGRTHLSLAGKPASPAQRMFGPGWVADVTGSAVGASGLTVVDRTAEDGSITLQAPWGESSVYQHFSGGRGAQKTGPYLGVGETGTFDETLVLETGGTGTATHTLTLTESDGATTTWERTTTGEWQQTKVQGGHATDKTVYDYNSDGTVSWIFAPSPTGVTCNSSEQQPGCRALHLHYITSVDGPRLDSVDLVIYDPKPDSEGRATTPLTEPLARIPVAKYAYTPEGLLGASWDPRLGDGDQALKTTYTYAQSGSRIQLATTTPPGEATWSFVYDASGRITSVQRPQPQATGTSTWTVGYDIPVSGAGLPDLSPSATAAWGQNEVDSPFAAVGVWNPNHIPAATPTSEDYAYAALSYFSAAGRMTNTAGYGAGEWQIETTWYDEQGNPTRTLTPANRRRALTDVDPATVAEELSSFVRYNNDGTRVEDEWGPARELVLEDGSTVVGRDHTSYLYDNETTDPVLLAGQPADAPASGYELVVEETHSVSDVDRVNDYDGEKSRFGYAPIVPEDQDGNGWALRLPTTVSVQLEDGTWSTETARYDREGKLIESRQPGGATDAAGRGSDPKSHRIVYYTSDDSAAHADCDNKPQWAGMECLAGPASQPSAGKPLPTAWMVGYDYLLNPTRVEERSGSVTRTIVTTMHVSGRPEGSSIQVINAPAGDQPIGDVAYTYDPATGQLASQSTGTDTIGLGYDSWGRQTSYTTTTGTVTNTATTTYDAADRVKTFNDGKGTYTYAYDGTDANGLAERRGLVTAVDVGLPSGPDSFTVAYNADAAPEVVQYPNGVTARWGYNADNDTTSLTYNLTGEELLGFTAAVDAYGRVRRGSSPVSDQTYSYDNLDRLVKVEDSFADKCETRVYGFDADSNRSSLDKYPGAAGGACSTATVGSSTTSTFDDADRITNAGYAYDDLGRTRTVPSTDTDQPTAGPLEIAYHANDMVASLTQSGLPDGFGGTLTQTKTFTLDAADRLRTATDTSNGTETRRIVNHYANETDSPAWIGTTVDAGANWSWERNVVAPFGDLAILQLSQGTSTVQLANLHGDVVATMANTSTAVGIESYSESTEYGEPREPANAPDRYGWLGAKQRSADALGGLTLMGVRLYNPATGRFLSVDPIVEGSPNRYLYPTDPVNAFDLDGKLWWFAIAAAARVCIRYCVRAAKGVYNAVRKTKMRKKFQRIKNRKERKHETIVSVVGKRKGIIFKVEWRGRRGVRHFLRLTRPHGDGAHKRLHWVGGYVVRRGNKWVEKTTYHKTLLLKNLPDGRTRPGPQP